MSNNTTSAALPSPTGIFLSALALASRFLGGSPPADQGQIHTSLPDGYKVVDLTWSGPITDSGPEETFTGASMRDIETKILAAHPDFKFPTVNATSLEEGLAKRDKDHLTCKPGVPGEFWYAEKRYIDAGIEYLAGKTGKCSIDAGPRTCSRISCSYDSGIYWCNDNPERIEENCLLFSHYAQDIVDECTFTHGGIEQLMGQEFSTSSWNIMAVWSKDHC
ncbi:hypothetical protein M426DRAFT_24019 [Hypoxylon sp. CI-4A]|nr:hypothetical protein M426DRAFT_24019 [Hypoxylon sp. CI-4A]